MHLLRPSIIATCVLGALGIQPSSAALLFYDGFSESDYTAGPVNGQDYGGMGYASDGPQNGLWNTNSEFVEEGLSHPDLFTTPGFHVFRTDGNMQGDFDLSPTGPFGAEGLIGDDGLIGGTGVTAPIYFSVLARKDSGDASFAGIQTWDTTGGGEGFGIGEVGDGGYKWFQGGSNNFIGDPPTPIVLGETHFFVWKLDFQDTAPTKATVWIDPDATLAEDAQPPESVTEVAQNVTPGATDGAFNAYWMRGTRTWSFDEVRIGTTWEDVTPTEGAAPLFLEITSDGTDLTFNWASTNGSLYNLRSVTDPSSAEPLDWPIYEDNADIEATPDFNTLTIPVPADATRFFVVEEFPAPPMVIFADDFESGQGTWATGFDGAADTIWEFGSPSVVGPPAANSGTNCFGTNLSSDYTNDTNTWLRSPAIDLTGAGGATLNYAEFRSIEAMFDSGTITVLDAADDSVIAEVASGIEGVSTTWETASYPLPEEALDKMIKIEFRLQSDDFTNLAGWYIDDVEVTVP